MNKLLLPLLLVFASSSFAQTDESLYSDTLTVRFLRFDLFGYFGGAWLNNDVNDGFQVDSTVYAASEQAPGLNISGMIRAKLTMLEGEGVSVFLIPGAIELGVYSLRLSEAYLSEAYLRYFLGLEIVKKPIFFVHPEDKYNKKVYYNFSPYQSFNFLSGVTDRRDEGGTESYVGHLGFSFEYGRIWKRKERSKEFANSIALGVRYTVDSFCAFCGEESTRPYGNDLPIISSLQLNVTVQR